MKLQITIRNERDRRFAEIIEATARGFFPSELRIRHGHDPKHPGTEILYISTLDPKGEIG